MAECCTITESIEVRDVNRTTSAFVIELGTMCRPPVLVSTGHQDNHAAPAPAPRRSFANVFLAAAR